MVHAASRVILKAGNVAAPGCLPPTAYCLLLTAYCRLLLGERAISHQPLQGRPGRWGCRPDELWFVVLFCRRVGE
jgi:hypothetical protein